MGRSKKAPNADGDFISAPFVNFNDRLKFDWNDIDNRNSNYGSASLMLPVCINH